MTYDKAPTQTDVIERLRGTVSRLEKRCSAYDCIRSKAVRVKKASELGATWPGIDLVADLVAMPEW